MTETTEAEIVIEWLGGNCPVQAEGTVKGKPFYFRARGEHWSMCIGAASGDLILKPDWYYEEEYGDGPFEAGWMREEEANVFIKKAAGMFAAGHPTSEMT